MRFENPTEQCYIYIFLIFYVFANMCSTLLVTRKIINVSHKLIYVFIKKVTSLLCHMQYSIVRNIYFRLLRSDICLYFFFCFKHTFPLRLSSSLSSLIWSSFFSQLIRAARSMYYESCRTIAQISERKVALRRIGPESWEEYTRPSRGMSGAWSSRIAGKGQS